MPSPLDLEQHLSRHGAALRQLARELLRDPHAADDAVQEVWVAALREPPQHDASIGGWLRTVLLHVVSRFRRSASRRERHETAAAPLDLTSDHAVVVAREEMARRLLAAVTALEQPYRDVVWQRFFEGLLPQQIAEQSGVPIATVKSRLQRGVGSLRERLGEGTDVDWRPAMAAAFGLGKGVATAAAAGASLTGATVATAVGTAVAVVAIGLVLWMRDGERPIPSPGRAGPEGSSLVAAGPPDTGPPVTGPPEGGPAASELQREAMANAATGSAAAVSPAAAPPAFAAGELATVRGRLVDATSGAPMYGANIVVRSIAASTELATCRTLADGSFVVALDVRGDVEVLLAAADHVGLAWRGELGMHRHQLDLGEVSMRPGRLLRGRVHDEHGAPAAAGLRVSAEFDLVVRQALHEVRPVARTDRHGAFTLSGPVPFGVVRWQLGVGQFGSVDPASTQVRDTGPDDVELVTKVPPPIRGVVVDVAGRPLRGIAISDHLRTNQVRTGADGSFALARTERDAAAATTLMVLDAPQWLPHPPLRGIPWGRDDVRIVLQPLAPFDLRVVDDVGQPVESFGVTMLRPGISPYSVGRVVQRGRHRGGALRLSNVWPGGTQLRVLPTDPELTPSGAIDVPSDAGQPLRIVLARRSELLVQVLDDGRPAGGVHVELLREQGGASVEQAVRVVDTTGSERVWMNLRVVERIAGGSTDATGRVRLRRDADLAGCVLRLRAAGRVDGHVRGLEAPSPGQPLVVELPHDGRVVGAIQLHGRTAADLRIEVLGTTLVQTRAIHVANDGTFTIDALSTGDYTVRVCARVLAGDHSAGSLVAFAEQRVTVGRGNNPVRFDLAEVPFARVHGSFVHSEPLAAGLELDLWRESDAGGYERVASAIVGGDGLFEFGEVLPGVYRAALRRGAFHPRTPPGLMAERIVVGPRSHVALRLAQRPQRFVLTLRRPDGQLVTGERVQLRLGGRPWPSETYQWPIVDGELVLEPAPELPIEVRGYDEGSPWSSPVSMPPDRAEAAAEVLVPLPPTPLLLTPLPPKAPSFTPR